MDVLKILRFSIILSLVSLMFLSSCSNGLKGGDASKISPNMKERQRQNIEEGRGFSFGKTFGNKAGEFDFASSNELWRASLDTLEFMPLSLANYSGGIIVTDWYTSESSINESVKISIRFLSNEVRSDALAIKVFYKKCSLQENCQITDKTNALSNDIEKKILTKAALYKKENKSK
tara:strand:+ start:271 stop:798 length:528 start_codon:yes stop_codon:yes gene_type:complete